MFTGSAGAGGFEGIRGCKETDVPDIQDLLAGAIALIKQRFDRPCSLITLFRPRIDIDNNGAHNLTGLIDW